MGHAKRTQWSGIWCVLTIAGSFLAGGVLGCLFGALTGDTGAEEIERYLRDFFALSAAGEVMWTVPTVLWHRGRWLLCCGIFGLSALGILFLPVLFGLRGFLLAFGVSCFVRIFGAAGLLPATLMFGVPAILWLPGFLLLGTVCMCRGLCVLQKGEGPSGVDVRKAILNAGLFLALCVIFECGLLPRLLSAAARILQ